MKKKNQEMMLRNDGKKPRSNLPAKVTNPLIKKVKTGKSKISNADMESVSNRSNKSRRGGIKANSKAMARL